MLQQQNFKYYNNKYKIATIKIENKLEALHQESNGKIKNSLRRRRQSF